MVKKVGDPSSAPVAGGQTVANAVLSIPSERQRPLSNKRTTIFDERGLQIRRSPEPEFDFQLSKSQRLRGSGARGIAALSLYLAARLITVGFLVAFMYYLSLLGLNVTELSRLVRGLASWL